MRDHGVGFEAESGPAGVPPVLAGRPCTGPYGGRNRARPGHLDGGREPAQRLADRLGPAGLGAQFRLTLPRRRAAILETSPLPWCHATWCPRTKPSEAADHGPDAACLANPPPPAGPPPGQRRWRRDWRPDAWAGDAAARWYGLAGCVSVPTAGPIETVAGKEPECHELRQCRCRPAAARRQSARDRRRISPGDVELPARLAVARQFLTRPPPDAGAPEASVRDLPRQHPGKRETGSRSTADWSACSAPTAPTTPQDRALQVGFGLVQEDGQWRISRPPPGLLVAEFAFVSFYLPFNLYFVGERSEPRSRPDLPAHLVSPAGLASALMTALLGRAVGVAEAGSDHGDPAGHRAQCRLRDDHRRRRRGTGSARRCSRCRTRSERCWPLRSSTPSSRPAAFAAC